MPEPVSSLPLQDAPPKRTNNAGVYARAFREALEIPIEDKHELAAKIGEVIDFSGARVLGDDLLTKAGQNLKTWLERNDKPANALHLKADMNTGDVFVFRS